jgi:Tol biopolymer transport system component
MTPGSKLGPYEILSSLGKGGMGEVWRARDPRLNREVAIKISAQQFTDRFEREAHAIASLNHPNICTLFDIGPNYLVMELIEGSTLAERISEGPIPLEEVLALARQIGDALEAAHEKGIVHRDLKPGNVKIRPDGSVKVLDFGLAKAGVAESAVSSESPTMLHSPTQIGVILGTAAYMAPEQARGKAVDKRADIWSFGIVLHEMVTGKRVFEGEDLTETLASVVKSDPDLTTVPAKVRRLLESCLQKDPKKRLRDIGDSWRLLEEAEAAPTPVAPPATRSLLWPVVAGVLAVVAGVVSFIHFREKPPQTNPVQFILDAPADNQYTNPFGATAISPDGRYLVFGAAAGSAAAQLWLRPVGSVDARVLPGTEGGNFPFWSPDSKSMAFFAAGKLKRIDIAGGTPVVLCDAAGGTADISGTWNEEGVILFASPDGLHRVAASGGAPAMFAKADPARNETGRTRPEFLPGGNRYIFFLSSPDANIQGIYAGSLDRPQEKTRVLATDHKAIYTPPHNGYPGALLWIREQTLMTQDFDAGSLRLSGDPAIVAENILTTSGGRAAFWASDAGVLVYRAGSNVPKSRLVWMNREGKSLEEAAPEDKYGSVALSPDEKRLALSRYDSADKSDIWVYDLSRKVMTRLTFGSDGENPVWSPDGRFIAYDSGRGGSQQLYRKDAAGSGQEEPLTSGSGNLSALHWSPDGKHIVFSRTSPRSSGEIWALPVEPDASGKRVAFPLFQTVFTGRDAAISPDGKWLAYTSAESGLYQLYVQAFPVAGGKWQVSNSGGLHPVWRGDGKEIFYHAGIGTQSILMATGIRTGPGGVEVDSARPLFSVAVFSGSPALMRPWVVTPDGQRFLIEERTGTTQTNPLTVVLNWQDGLKK